MKKLILIVLLIFVFFNILAIEGMLNPAAVYCNELGYSYVTKETPEGQISVCKFPDGTECPSWDFLLGKCGTEYSYCKIKGYEIKSVFDYEKCSSISNPECSVCILENGSEVEVTKLMGLSFIEGKCGDGKCTIGENYNNCPEDCPSGSYDMYCDKVEDGICDPDCIEREMIDEDPDCKEVTTTTIETKKCGDRICEKGVENFGNCPEDCPSGGEDGYCDGVEDGICDKDCEKFGKGKDWRKLDKDCICNKDGNCEVGIENFLNCKEDCPSGSRDGYCDKVKDGICDLDCKKFEDVDCGKKSSIIYYILIVLGIIISLAILRFFIYKNRK